MRYAIIKTSEEIKNSNRKSIKPGCTSDCENSETIEIFESKEEALEALKGYSSKIQQLSGYYLVTEYAVAEEIEDDFFEDMFGDIWEFSEMKIEVVSKPDYETLATFDNLEQAEQFKNDSNIECYISFS